MANIKNILPDKRRTTVLISLVILLAVFLVPYFFVFIPANADNLKRQAFLKLDRAAQNIISKSNDTHSYFHNNTVGADTISWEGLRSSECIGSTEPVSRLDSQYFIFRGQSGWNILYVFARPQVDSSNQKDAHATHTFQVDPVNKTANKRDASDDEKNKSTNILLRFDSKNNKAARMQFQFNDDKNSDRNHANTGKDTGRLIQKKELSLETFMPPCLSSAKEVFSAFLLIHYCQHIGTDSGGKIIFEDFSQGLEQNIILDSLIPRHEGIRPPDMSDISLEGTDYKLFSYPFQLGRHRLMLCGLLKSETYNAQLHQIPVATVYTIVICLILFLLSLPFLKIFMMNERDRIYAGNLATGIIFLFVTATIITLIATQLILLQRQRNQVTANLESLSRRIEDSLSSELTRAQAQLIYFDQELGSFVNTPCNQTMETNEDYPFLITRDKNHPETTLDKRRIRYSIPPIYQNFDHCAWIDSNGQELFRIKYLPKDMLNRFAVSFPVDTISFVDVRARQYYQEMVWHKNYQGSIIDSTLMLAPVQSWVSGEFRVNLCRYSNNKGLLLALMETRLSSLVNTVLPSGYGYCLFNDSGSVLIHSDTLKSLRENFLDETGRPSWITGAVKGRQAWQAGSVSFYGTNYSLRIQPLQQHPLYLAVFYNNDYLEPVNVRILTFSIFFCLLEYGLLLVFFQILRARDPKTCLYTATDYLRQMIPHGKNQNLYFNGSLLLIIYIFCYSAAMILSSLIGFDTDYTVLVFGLLTPVHLCYGLWLTQDKSGRNGGRAGFLVYILPPIIVACVLFFLSYVAGWGLNPVSFFVMETAFWFGFWTIIRPKGTKFMQLKIGVKTAVQKKSGWTMKSVEDKKLFGFSSFVGLFVFAIAVLPTLDFSWFAYNHEVRQSVKKEQLEIADGLQRREKNVRAFLRSNQPDFTGNDKNFLFIQYRQGIYPAYADSVIYVHNRKTTVHEPAADLDPSESFYLTTAGTSNLFYKDPSGLPPLNDFSHNDNLWQWDYAHDTYQFFYSRPKWKVPPMLGTDSAHGSNFTILTPMPEDICKNILMSFMLAAFLLVLLLVIYQITKSITQQVCITRIVGNAAGGLYDPFENGTTAIWKTCMKTSDDTSVVLLLKTLKDEYTELDTIMNPTEKTAAYTIGTDKSEKNKNAETRKRVNKIGLALLESEILATSDDNSVLFECIWNTLTDKEKYLLFCLARDGLLNHKNEVTIYKLLRKNLLVVFDQRIRLVSYSFRNFLLSRVYSPGEKDMLASMQSGASWVFMRTVVLVLVISIFIFLFLTRQEVSIKIIALITSLSTLLPFVLKFGSSSAPAGESKS